MTIWKFELEVTDRQTVSMPDGAEILCVQTQNGKPCLWAKVDQMEPDQRRKTIWTVGTGHELPGWGNLAYIGTYQLLDGALVFHVFEEG